MKNPHAVALGKRNKGKKKNLSQEEKERRHFALNLARKKRWPHSRTSESYMGQDSKNSKMDA